MENTWVDVSRITNPEEKRRTEAVLMQIYKNNKSGFWVKKRMLDILVSCVGLAIFGIPMLIIAALIFCSDRHNPLYSQMRVGRHGKLFKMYKFRTMVPDADQKLDLYLEKNEMDGPVFKISNDPRITRVGKLLRKTSLDELPQFFNVLLGNMTIIGPRPPLPREVEQYTEYQKLRLIVTGGLTCIWQIHPSRNKVKFDDWVDMDIDYVLNRNMLLDMKIIFGTLVAMCRKEGQ